MMLPFVLCYRLAASSYSAHPFVLLHCVVCLQRAIDAVVIALRRNVMNHLKELEQYVDEGTEKMSMRPASLSDIAKSQRQWKELSDSRATMRTMMSNSEEERRLLVAVGTGVVDVTELQMRSAKLMAQWESFDAALDAFTGVVEEQRAALRGLCLRTYRGVSTSLRVRGVRVVERVPCL